MKVCQRCGREYHDDEQNFCLADGTPLVDGASLPTIALSSPSDPTVVMTTPQVARTTRAEGRRKSNALMIVLISLGLIALVGVSGFFMAAMMRKGDEVKANQAARNAASQKAKPSPQPTGSIAVQAEPLDTPASPADDDSAATPITWGTAGYTFDTTAGKKYKFECPASGTAGMVWGSDVYMVDSSICTAAVHAGKINLEGGGEITIEFRPGRSVYGATIRNGITSYNYGQSAHSFVFVGGSTPAKD